MDLQPVSVQTIRETIETLGIQQAAALLFQRFSARQQKCFSVKMMLVNNFDDWRL